MRVAPGEAEEPLWDAVFEAAVEAGHPVADDLNFGSGEGSAEASTPWCTVCGRARPMAT
jgi:hypothetical protein